MRTWQRYSVEANDHAELPVRKTLLRLAERSRIPRCPHPREASWACASHPRSGVKCEACLQIHLGRRHGGQRVRTFEAVLYALDSSWLGGVVRVVVADSVAGAC